MDHRAARKKFRRLCHVRGSGGYEAFRVAKQPPLPSPPHRAYRRSFNGFPTGELASHPWQNATRYFPLTRAIAVALRAVKLLLRHLTRCTVYTTKAAS